MRARVWLLVTTVLFLPGPGLAPSRAQESPEPLPAVEFVLARNVEARGGLERLRSIGAMKIAGTISGPLGDDVPTTIYMKRPDRIRQEIRVEGQTLVQAFDGRRGWSLNPLMGQGAVEVPAAVARRMAEQADFDGPLVEPATKGHRVEVVARERVGDRPAIKLQLRKKSGEVQFVWLDAERWLELKSESTVDQDGRGIVVESRNSDFRTVDGVTTPGVVEVYADRRLQQRIAVQSIEFPADLPDDLFQFPDRRQ